MRHYIYLLPALLATSLLASCYQGDGEDGVSGTEIAQVKRFTFHVKGDFQTAYEDMTRSVRLEDDNTAGITDLWVMDYVGETAVQTVHQSAGDEDFGHPSMNLAYGHHDIRFVASRGAGPSVTTSGITWGKVLDTYCLSYPVDVTAGSNGNRAPELKRCVAGVTIVNTDAVPASAKEMQVTVMGRYATLSLPSLTGGGEGDFTNVFGYLASDAGTTGLKLTTYSLCPSEEGFAVDVAVKVLDKDGGVLSAFSIGDVELRANRKTVLQGECFGRSDGFEVSLDNAWDEDCTIRF